MKLTALIVTTMNRIVIGALTSVESECGRLVRQRDEVDLDALQHHDAGGEHLAGQLGQRVELPTVVDRPDETDDRRAHQDRRPAARRELPP